MKKKCPYCFIARIAVLAFLGMGLSWLRVTDGFQTSCTGLCSSITNTLFLPAEFFAGLLGNNVEGAGGLNFTIGLVIEIWILWLVAVWIVKAVLQSRTET